MTKKLICILLPLLCLLLTGCDTGYRTLIVPWQPTGIALNSEADLLNYEAALERIAEERIARDAKDWLEHLPDSAALLDVQLSQLYPWSEYDLLVIDNLRKVRAKHPAMLPCYDEEALKYIRIECSFEGEPELLWLQLSSDSFKHQLGGWINISYTYLEPEAYLHPDIKLDATMPVQEIVDDLGLASVKECNSTRIQLGDRTVDALMVPSKDTYYFVYDCVLVRVEAPCDEATLEAWMTALTFQGA